MTSNTPSHESENLPMSVEPEPPHRELLKRLRRYLRSQAADGSIIGDSYTEGPFLPRLFRDPNTYLSPLDFLKYGYRLENPVNGKVLSKNTIGVHRVWLRFGRRPFSRYYLVTVIVTGDIWKQQICYTVCERRFSGLFALYRLPHMRKSRILRFTVKELGANIELLGELWKDGIDISWHNETKRASSESMATILGEFAQKLNF